MRSRGRVNQYSSSIMIDHIPLVYLEGIVVVCFPVDAVALVRQFHEVCALVDVIIFGVG